MGKLPHRGASGGHHTQRGGKVRRFRRICSLRQFRPVLAHVQGEGRQVPLLLVKLECEALGQKLLQDLFHLHGARYPQRIRLHLDVPFLCVQPTRPPTICRSGMSYANSMMNLSGKFLTTTFSPCVTSMKSFVPGSVGLMVATSTSGFASVAIGRIRCGGAGVVHSVSGVARTSTRGNEPNCVTVPLIEFPSADIFPSYVNPGN